MSLHKKIFSDTPIFEAQFAAFEEISDSNNEPTTVNGYHSKLRFYMNNMHLLQKRYETEIGAKDAIVKTVDFINIAPFIFRSHNKINYRFWKSHLREVGKAITFCNPDFTPFEIKNALLRVYQRNIFIPYKIKPTPETWKSYHLSLSQDLDVIVNQVISEVPSKGRKVCNKVIYNPNKNFTPKQRRSISGKLTPSRNGDKTLEKLQGLFTEGMTQKDLWEQSQTSRSTIKRYWHKLQTA